MAFITFSKHPGDLLTITNIKHNKVIINIGKFSVKLTSPVKYTAQGYQVFFKEFWKDNREKQEFIEEINNVTDIINYTL